MKNISLKQNRCVKDIPIGECFLYETELFMITDSLTDRDGDDIICVNLSNGTIPSRIYIDWETLVTPVNINIDVL